MFQIMVVDDDRNTRRLLQAVLEADGYKVLTAENGEDALALMDSEYVDLVVLDIMMPQMDGYEFTRTLRETNNNLPVLMVSAKELPSDKKHGFLVGTDDYMTKPFDSGELLARVRAALRVNRYGGGSLPGGVFSAQGLTINYERRKVFVDGQEVRLTQTEYNIVAFLSEHAGRVMTYAAIVRAIWGDTDASSTKKLQVNMANIRKKLGSRPGSNTYILNELGVGYRMIEEDAKPLEPAEETK